MNEYIQKKKPICPNCDEVIDIAKENLWELYSEDTIDIDCPHCKVNIAIISHAVWTFSTGENCNKTPF